MAGLAAVDRKRLAEVGEASARVALVVLFGSHARGRAHASSDVDVAVLAPNATPDERRDIEVALMRCSRRPVDVIFLDAAPPLLRFEVARHGEALFERTRGCWIAERAQAMVAWWDWAPVARRMGRAAVARLRQEAS